MSNNAKKTINPLKQMLYNIHGTCFIRNTMYQHGQMDAKQMQSFLLRDNITIMNGIRGLDRKKDYKYMYHPYRTRMADRKA